MNESPPPFAPPTVSTGSDRGVARLLAVGDIHGCRRQLKTLLDLVAPTADDQLVFLGDYIDRGPDSAGVIDDLIELRERLPNTVLLRGNHEQMLLDVLQGADPTTFLVNGGGRTMAGYRGRGQWPPPPEHLAFYRQLPVCHITERFVFAHAGLRPGRPAAVQQPDDLLWIRGEFLDSDAEWGKTVVFGHTPREQPLLAVTRIGLDTGCVYGGRLTCCDVLSRRYWQARD
ncbi:MAG: serine/threonine protein phosphatase [Deltaproteobacteria bacterium]|nr:MAG: serine/threonine protein phosphatase [Deltaproteobacteria bacterium]